jgi:hypothetical protein
MKWFKIDGIEWDVKVFEPKESFSILYSKNTGRTLDTGAPMVLDPLGTFYNYSMTFGAKKGKEQQFEDLWRYLSVPRKEPMLFLFPKSSNGYWQTEDESGSAVDGFYAYVSNGERGIKKILEDVNGELKQVVYEAFTVNVIATRAQVTP